MEFGMEVWNMRRSDEQGFEGLKVARTGGDHMGSEGMWQIVLSVI